MVQHRIGVTKSQDTYEMTGDFWEALAEPEQQDTVPSNEVPLANSFETRRLFLAAIEGSDGSRRAVSDTVPDFDSRHADLYGTAGWLLAFVHKETPKQTNGREVRRWGLTSDGKKYLKLHELGETEAARELLVAAIRDVEIVQRVYEITEADGEISYDSLRETLSVETTLSEASVARRASTVAQWLTALPGVEAVTDGRSKKFVRV